MSQITSPRHGRGTETHQYLVCFAAALRSCQAADENPYVVSFLPSLTNDPARGTVVENDVHCDRALKNTICTEPHEPRDCSSRGRHLLTQPQLCDDVCCTARWRGNWERLEVHGAAHPWLAKQPFEGAFALLDHSIQQALRLYCVSSCARILVETLSCKANVSNLQVSNFITRVQAELLHDPGVL